MTDEAEDAGPAQVVPLAALSVVTQPGAVKIVHRSGRVVYTFAGATMMADGLALADELVRVLGDESRIAREVLLKKPWWKFW